MSFLYELPADFRLTMMKLSEHVLQQFELASYVVEQLTIPQLASEILGQLPDIEPHSAEDTTYLRYLKYWCLHLSGDTIGILDEFTLETIVDYIWYQLGLRQKYTKQGSSTWDDIEEFPEPDQHVDQKFHQLLNVYNAQELQFETAFKLVKEIIEEYSGFLLRNFNEYTMVFHVVETYLVGLEERISLFNKLFRYATSINHRWFTGFLGYQLGIAHTNLYQFTSAEKYLTITKKNNDQAGFNNATLIAQRGLAYLYRIMGKFDKARTLYQNVLNKFDDITLLERVINHSGIAMTYEAEGKYNLALQEIEMITPDYFEFESIWLLTHHAVFALESNRDDRYQSLVDRIEVLIEETSSDEAEIHYNWMQMVANRVQSNYGLAMKMGEIGIDLAIEANLLPQILTLYKEIIKTAVELYELKTDTTSRARLFSYINDFLTLMDEQQIPIGSVQALKIRAKVHTIDENYEEAKADLINALKLIDKFDYDHLDEEYHEELDAIIELENNDEDDSGSIFTSLKNSIKGLLSLNREEEYREVDYTNHGLIVLSEHGTPVYDEYFTSVLRSDSSLISGIISAVSSFLGELTSGRGGYLKSIQHEDLSILLEPFGNFLTVVIVSEETLASRRQVQHLTEEFDRVFKDNGITSHPGNIPQELSQQISAITDQVFAA